MWGAEQDFSACTFKHTNNKAFANKYTHNLPSSRFMKTPAGIIHLSLKATFVWFTYNNLVSSDTLRPFLFINTVADKQNGSFTCFTGHVRSGDAYLRKRWCPGLSEWQQPECTCSQRTRCRCRRPPVGAAGTLPPLPLPPPSFRYAPEQPKETSSSSALAPPLRRSSRISPHPPLHPHGSRWQWDGRVRKSVCWTLTSMDFIYSTSTHRRLFMCRHPLPNLNFGIVCYFLAAAYYWAKYLLLHLEKGCYLGQQLWRSDATVDSSWVDETALHDTLVNLLHCHSLFSLKMHRDVLKTWIIHLESGMLHFGPWNSKVSKLCATITIYYKNAKGTIKGNKKKCTIEQKKIFNHNAKNVWRSKSLWSQFASAECHATKRLLRHIVLPASYQPQPLQTTSWPRYWTIP